MYKERNCELSDYSSEAVEAERQFDPRVEAKSKCKDLATSLYEQVQLRKTGRNILKRIVRPQGKIQHSG